jgi:membrane protease YdiL (CAAX protease family)
MSARELYDQSQAMNLGPVPQRLRFIVAAGELAGPDEALRLWRELDHMLAQRQVALPDEHAQLMDIVRRLYQDYERGDAKAASVSPEERRFLAEQLGWFGELALEPPSVGARALAAQAGAAPAAAVAAVERERPERDTVLEPARRTFVLLIGTLVVFVFLGALGFLGLVTFLVFLWSGKLTAGIETGVTSGGVYAETFAVWIALFLGLLAALGSVPGIPMLIGSGAAMFMSLLAVLWPVIRGIPWRQVREDIGWTLGRNPLLEPLIGVGCYVMALPLVGVGLGLTLILMFVQRTLMAGGAGDPLAPTSGPTHPVVEFLGGGDLFLRLQVILLASVIAPLVEETMFRGVLYRHLREASAAWRWLPSVIFSGTVSSFIFAAVHPQGIVAVPVLMALAYGFAIAREWRGTLIPAIVGHALNNGLVTTLAVYMLT